MRGGSANADDRRMAKSDHLELVRGRHINDYRTRYPAFIPDLRGANLRRFDLRELNLREADLTKARFDFARLYKTDLRRAKLTGANFDDATLQRIRMNGADLALFFVGLNSIERSW